MSAVGKFSELRVRILLCLVIAAVGALGGWRLGFRHEFPFALRPTATIYMQGYLAFKTGLCTRSLKPFHNPRSCTYFLAWNRDAVSPGVPASYRGLAWTLWNGTSRIAHLWAPGGVIGALAAASVLALLMRRDGAGWWIRRKVKRKGHWVRGARLVSARRLSLIARRRWGNADLALAGVCVPREIEGYHFGLIGTTGQGKTTALIPLLDDIDLRGDRVIATDANGKLLSRYGFDPARGDLILNPLDARSMPWSPLAEIRTELDVAAIACALIPDGSGEAAEWHGYAQTFMTDVLKRAFAEGATNARIVEMATVSEVPKLRSLLANSPSARLSAKENERFFGSVMSIVTAHIKPLMLCNKTAGRDALSIRRWVNDGHGKAFFNYQDDQLAAVKYLAGAMLDVASNAVLGLPEDDGHHIWIVLDEIASLGRVQSLQSFLTLSRKHGGRGILGLQSISQLRELYGVEGAETILGQLSNKLLLAVNDPNAADYASRLLGDAQYMRRILSGGRSDAGSHVNWSWTPVIERIVLASEISGLRIRRGYLTLTGGLPAANVKIRVPRRRISGCQPFLLRTMPEITLADFAPRDADGTASKRPLGELPNFGEDEDQQP